MARSSKIRIYITGIISIAIWGLLAWNYFHGGVPSHHILNKKDLPEISNWWGGLLLPLLTWFLLFRVQKRENLEEISFSKPSKYILYGFLGAFLIAFSIALLFTFDVHEIPGYLLMGILLLSLFYPIYRAECLLGFVLGMTFTFGAVLPTGIGSILSIIGFLIYNLIRPAAFFVVNFSKSKN